MNIALTHRVRVPDDVLVRTIEGESVLVHLGTGNYFGLDPIATRILGWIAERGTVALVLACVLAAYEVEAGRAEAELLQLLDELHERGLVEIVPTAGATS